MEKKLLKIKVGVVILMLLVLGGAAIMAIRKPSEPSFPDFSLEKVIQEDALTRYYEYRGQAATLRLKVMPKIDATEAKKVIDGKILTIEALYGNELSPYPGMISNEIVCSGDMVPKKQEILEGSLAIPYFVAALTDRFAYGNCVESETPYRGIIAWTHCPTQKEYRQMELIYAKENFDEKGLTFVQRNICD